jgi:hypothetical protein
MESDTLCSMGSLRVHLQRFAKAWLTIQIVALVAAPIAARIAGGSSIAQVCTCPGGDHQTCPMHHGQTHDAADGTAAPSCVLQNAAMPIDAALLPLIGGLGVMPVVRTSVVVTSSAVVFVLPARVVTRRELPDAPPPRA